MPSSPFAQKHSEMSARPASNMPQNSTQGVPGDISDMYNPAAYGRLDEKEMLLAVKADSRVDVLAMLIELAGRR